MKKSKLINTVERLPPSDKANTHKVDKFNMLLYVEDEKVNASEVIEKLKEWDKVSAVSYILHDSDYFNEDTFATDGHLIGRVGEKKQNHYHVTVHLVYRCTISDIAMHLGVAQRFIETCKSYEGSLNYLTHINAPEKHQYPIELVVSNVKEYVEYLYNNFIPKMDILALCRKYCTIDEFPCFTRFIDWLYENNSMDLSHARKDWAIVRDYLNEYKSKLPKGIAEYEAEVQRHKNNLEFIAKICSITEDHTARMYDEDGIHYTTWKLSSDGKVDCLGYSVERED